MATYSKIFFCIVLSFSIVFSQTYENKQEVKYTIEHLPNKIITVKSVSVFSLGDSISVTLNRLKGFEIKSNSFTVTLYENGKIALRIWSKDGGKTIGGFTVFSNKFTSDDGIRIGMSIADCMKFTEIDHLKRSEVDFDEEYFMTKKDMIVWEDDNGKNRFVRLYIVKPIDNKSVGIYAKNAIMGDYAEFFRENGIVKQIDVFNWH